MSVEDVLEGLEEKSGRFPTFDVHHAPILPLPDRLEDNLHTEELRKK